MSKKQVWINEEDKAPALILAALLDCSMADAIGRAIRAELARVGVQSGTAGITVLVDETKEKQEPSETAVSS